MSANKYIIILIFFIVTFNCAPPDNIRQKNNTGQHRNHYQNKSYIYWQSKEYKNTNDYKSNFEDKPENSCSKDEYVKKPETKSGKPVLTKTNRNINSDNNWNPKRNIYPDKIQKKNDNGKNNNTKNNIIVKLQNYKVRKGDNLTKISKKFNVSLNELISINKIKNDNKIFVGMILKIPDKLTKRIDYTSCQKIQNKPNFAWPIKNIYNTKRDNIDGVKPIGIIITGEKGSAVFSSADGIVTKVGNMRGFGCYVILKHINQYLTIYSNLKDINVNEGEKIRCGKNIGRLEGNELHFQIGHSGKPQDPLVYLSKKS